VTKKKYAKKMIAQTIEGEFLLQFRAKNVRLGNQLVTSHGKIKVKDYLVIIVEIQRKRRRSQSGASLVTKGIGNIANQKGQWM